MKKIATIIIMVFMVSLANAQVNTVKDPDNSSAKLSIKAYPNPAKSILYISFADDDGTEPVVLKITDLLGNEIYINENAAIDKVLEIDIEKLGLVSGIYIIKAQHRGKSSMRKVVVQN